jgi:hypothetical protein
MRPGVWGIPCPSNTQSRGEAGASFRITQPVYLKLGSYRGFAPASRLLGQGSWVKAPGSRTRISARTRGSFQVVDASARANFTTEPLLGYTSSKEGIGSWWSGPGRGEQGTTSESH